MTASKTFDSFYRYNMDDVGVTFLLVVEKRCARAHLYLT